jgi:hypothetical protein
LESLRELTFGIVAPPEILQISGIMAQTPQEFCGIMAQTPQEF